MSIIHSVFCLFVCALLQEVRGRATDAVDNLRIAGGHRIRITDAPFMASLYDYEGPMCGGSIIHEKFILTSADCAQDGRPIRKVHVGSNHDELRGIYIDVEEKLCHEHFNERTFENDICLLKLRNPLQFNKRVAKVNLPSANVEAAAGTLVNITGWGLKSNGQYPTRLQQATVSIKSKQACLEIDSTMTDNTFCAGSPRRDACDGDYGGPLTVNNVQIGIVSYGTTTSCGRVPSFYTKVSKYVNWINNKISANS